MFRGWDHPYSRDHPYRSRSGQMWELRHWPLCCERAEHDGLVPGCCVIARSLKTLKNVKYCNYRPIARPAKHQVSTIHLWKIQPHVCWVSGTTPNTSVRTVWQVRLLLSLTCGPPLSAFWRQHACDPNNSSQPSKGLDLHILRSRETKLEALVIIVVQSLMVLAECRIYQLQWYWPGRPMLCNTILCDKWYSYAKWY